MPVIKVPSQTLIEGVSFLLRENATSRWGRALKENFAFVNKNVGYEL